MRLRNVCFLVVTLAAGACGTSPGDNVSENADEARKADAGQKCRPPAPGDPSPCAKGGAGNDHGGGKADAGKGRSDGDDDDDDDDDREDGGKK